MHGRVKDPKRLENGLDGSYSNGNRHSTKDFRSVSLTSIVCKVLEATVRDAMMEHLLNNLLKDCQHGFMPSRSCLTQLLKVLDVWTQILERGGIIDNIYLDFVKAVDSIPMKG
ncbi:uncharacterized protein LOC121860564 [Homarus americanus]|uniref:uncharacterized protein LOC121860564 n=1 Tax=Homarus americanus TaxID=6706 RepID=UPI001C46F638|nr:uncharacterized protein LOC121860564 [Homarus americanus]